MNIRLTIEYDGSHFHGWQTQPGVRTVQEALREALETVLRQPIGHITAAGRTDAGVHARGQVVNVKVNGPVDLSRLQLAVSCLLKNQLSVIEAVDVPESFDARFDAKLKEYRYEILHRAAPPTIEYGRCWHITVPLNHTAMREAAASLVGRHDFSSMRGTGCVSRTAVKDIVHSELSVEGQRLTYRVVGRSFLKHMVRNIVGTVVAIGRSEASPGDGAARMAAVLDARDRRAAGVTAPAHGLTLEWVRYADSLAKSLE